MKSYSRPSVENVLKALKSSLFLCFASESANVVLGLLSQKPVISWRPCTLHRQLDSRIQLIEYPSCTNTGLDHPHWDWDWVVFASFFSGYFLSIIFNNETYKRRKALGATRSKWTSGILLIFSHFLQKNAHGCLSRPLFSRRPTNLNCCLGPTELSWWWSQCLLHRQEKKRKLLFEPLN